MGFSIRREDFNDIELAVLREDEERVAQAAHDTAVSECITNMQKILDSCKKHLQLLLKELDKCTENKIPAVTVLCHLGIVSGLVKTLTSDKPKSERAGEFVRLFNNADPAEAIRASGNANLYKITVGERETLGGTSKEILKEKLPSGLSGASFVALIAASIFTGGLALAGYGLYQAAKERNVKASADAILPPAKSAMRSS